MGLALVRMSHLDTYQSGSTRAMIRSRAHALRRNHFFLTNIAGLTRHIRHSSSVATKSPLIESANSRSSGHEQNAGNDAEGEESDKEKTRRFKRRWSMYLTGAFSATTLYKMCKSPQHYSKLPAEISDAPLSFRSFIFSNVLANRALSRICAKLTEKEIPTRWRKYIYGAVGLFWKVEWNEFKPNLEHYPTFKQWFTRPLEYPRTLARCDMVSPTDGTVLTFGEVDKDNAMLEQIKGVKFKLQHFLYGYDDKDMHPNMMDYPASNGNKLYYTIIYLCPGDYHRFHAPSDDIKIDCINHLAGDLYPVKPSWLKKIPGLFTLNERIVLSGKWKDDLYFAYVPVGAFNVGTICLTADDRIRTNQKAHDPDVWYKNGGQNRNQKNDPKIDFSPYERNAPQTPFVKKYIQHFEQGQEVEYNKGDEVGYFAFGSTVVMVFEAPNFKFNVEPNQKIRFGDSLGNVIAHED